MGIAYRKKSDISAITCVSKEGVIFGGRRREVRNGRRLEDGGGMYSGWGGSFWRIALYRNVRIRHFNKLKQRAIITADT